MLRKLKKISTTSPSWMINPSLLSSFRPSTCENPSELTMLETSLTVENHLGDDDEDKLASSAVSKDKKLSTPPNSFDHPCPKLEEDPKNHSENIADLASYEDKCPPGGKETVVLYSTSLRGIRKTFEDCNAIRFLLGSFRVVYSERDVSMHMEYRDELWRIMCGRVVPPRLFIRGRYIGGAEEVVRLHENGALRTLLHGISLTPSSIPCKVCAGQHFVLCPTCDGSRRVLGGGHPIPTCNGRVTDGPQQYTNGTPRVRCPDCNENGLVKCALCS